MTVKKFSLIICAVLILNLCTGCGGSDKYLGITQKEFAENFNKQLKPISKALKINLDKFEIVKTSEFDVLGEPNNVIYHFKNSDCNFAAFIKEGNLHQINLQSTEFDEALSLALTMAYSIPKTAEVKSVNKLIGEIFAEAYIQSDTSIERIVNGVRFGVSYSYGKYFFAISSKEEN